MSDKKGQIRGRIAKFFASCFYTGYFPIAPGTVGSFVALVLYWICPGSRWPVLLLVSFGLFFFGVWCATIAEKQWSHDDGKITIDEAVGMLVALIAVPKTLVLVGIAFVAFRFFDIVKPFPASRAERLPAGWGIMTDDLIAGIYANIVTQIVYVIFLR